MTVLLFISLLTRKVVKQNTNTFKLASVMPWPPLIISAGQMLHYKDWSQPYMQHFYLFLFWQFLNDNSGYRIPACRCITSGVVGTGPHPHGHIHQPCFHTLAEPFDWRKEKGQLQVRERPNCLQGLGIIFLHTLVAFPKPDWKIGTSPQQLNSHLKE